MTNVRICEIVRDECWENFESNGYLCSGCACCSLDQKTRFEARIEILREKLGKAKRFVYSGDEETRTDQAKFIKSKIKLISDEIEFYKDELKKLEGDNGNDIRELV